MPSVSTKSTGGLVFIRRKADRDSSKLTGSGPSKRSLRRRPRALTWLPEHGPRLLRQDQSAALGTGLQDVVALLGLRVERAGEVQGRAVPYLRQLTEGGLLDTACRQEIRVVLLGPAGRVTSAAFLQGDAPQGLFPGRPEAQGAPALQSGRPTEVTGVLLAGERAGRAHNRASMRL